MINKCKVCDKEFLVHKLHPKTKYCSQKCRSKGYYLPKGIGVSRTKKCFACDKEFVTKYNNKVVCSPKCRTKMWHMKNPKRKLWKEYKEKYPDKVKESFRQWSLNNPELVKARRKRYYNKNKTKIMEKHKLWNKNNRWYCNECSRLHREKKNKTIRKYTRDEWEEKLKCSNGICVRCGEYFGIDNLERDHIYPIAQAYKDYLKTGIKKVYTINDIQVLCRRCNVTKGSKVEV